MVAANNADFMDGTGGFADPFTGLAPAETPEQEQARRLMQRNYDQTQTRNINLLGNDQSAATTGDSYSSHRASSERNQRFHANPSMVIDAYIYGKTDPDGNRISQGEYEAAKALQKGNHDAMNTFGYKALTGGLLALPAAVTGAGFAIGGAQGLGFGLGEGSIAGASGTPATMVANEATGGAMAGPGFSQEAANAYNAASAANAAGAAGGAGGAASGAAGGASAFAKNFGLPALEALAPLAIQQATGGRTKEQKQLIEAQQQMALEAEKRRGEVQDARMNSLAQQVLAFNPRNQLLAQMVGPQAAFSADQAAQMVQGQEPPMDQNLLQYAGNDQPTLRRKAEMIRRHNEWLQSEQQRRDMMMNNWQQPGPGPAPINMPAPQAARRL